MSSARARSPLAFLALTALFGATAEAAPALRVLGGRPRRAVAARPPPRPGDRARRSPHPSGLGARIERAPLSPRRPPRPRASLVRRASSSLRRPAKARIAALRPSPLEKTRQRKET